MDNAPLGWMPKQKFLKILYLDIYFFNIYINDLPDNLTSNSYLFADDTLLFPQQQIQMLQQIRSIMIYITLVHGLTNGKWILILILVNKQKRSYLAVKVTTQ